MIFTLPLDCCVILLFLLACAGAGRRLLAFFARPGDEPALGELLLSAGLGLFAVSYLVYGLGLAGWVYRPVLLALLAALVWFGRAELAGLYRRLRALELPALTRTEKLLLGAVAAAALFNFLYNYCPPAGEDEISTHLGLPAKWAAAHAIYVLPGASAQYFPSGVLMHYLALAAAGSVQAARLFHYVCGLFCLLAVYALARRFLARGPALLAAALFYTMPAVTSLSGIGNTDLGTLFYALLAVYAYVRWLGVKEPRGLLLAALFAGAHAACKYTGFPLLIILPLLVLYEGRRRLPGAFARAAAAGAVSFSALLPYLARNAWLTGNPIFPTRLPGLSYDEMLYLGHLKGQSLADLPRLLAGFSGAGDIIWGTGPVFAAFLPLLFFFRLKDQAGRDVSLLLLSVAVLNGLLLYAAGISFQLTRHSLLSFALLSIPLAHAAGLACAAPGLRRYITALLSLSLLTNLLLPFYFGGKRLPVFLGLQSRAAYFNGAYGIWEKSYIVNYINEKIPAGTGIFFLNDLAAPQLNYPAHRVCGMDAFKPSFYALSPREAAAEFERRGISCVVVVWDRFKPAGAAGALWASGAGDLPVRWLVEGLLKPVTSRDNVTLYSVERPARTY